MIRFLLLTPLALALSGCAAWQLSRPTSYVEKPVDLPAVWSQSAEGNEGKIATGWLATFRDREMTQLVKEAMAHNRNLRRSAAQLRGARENLVSARANRLPSISASGSTSRSGNRSREADGDLGGWDRSKNYGLSFSASWEVDLWGRLRDLEEATVADFEATLADFRSARLSLAANTAKAWCNLITAQQLVKSAEQTRDTFERNFRITERNLVGAGEGNFLNVLFGRNDVASAERSLRNAQFARDESARAIEVLLGRYPSASIEGRAELPDLPNAVPAGLPSELLMRRPDLVAAAADLRSSASRADAARKNLLPSIRLSGSASRSSNELLDLIADPRSIGWSAASSLAQSIYRGGALTADARQALAQNEAAIESFAATALRAFQEVESALAQERNLLLQEEDVNLEMETATLAERQADRGATEGLVSTLEVLEARRRVTRARNAQISLRNQRLQNRIDLHLALGGDFETLPNL